MPISRHDGHTQSPDRADRSAWHAVADLASGQNGLVTTAELSGCGISQAQRLHGVRTARLHRRHRRVFSVGHRDLGRDGRLKAALLQSGSGSVLAGRPSLVFFGLLKDVGSPVEVLTPKHRRSSPGIVVSRRPFHPRKDVRYRRGLAVLSPLAALADAAGSLPRPLLVAAVEEAAVRGWLPPVAVAELLERVAGRPGAPSLRAALGALDPSKGRTRSQLERAFQRFCRKHGLPDGERGVLIDIGGGDLREMDVWYAGPRVNVELDGLTFHEAGTAPVRDRRRDRRLIAVGVRTVRVTWGDLDDHPDELADDLKATLGIA